MDKTFVSTMYGLTPLLLMSRIVFHLSGLELFFPILSGLFGCSVVLIMLGIRELHRDLNAARCICGHNSGSHYRLTVYRAGYQNLQSYARFSCHRFLKKILQKTGEFHSKISAPN